MGKRIVIIDGNSLINRAYYAMQRPMITKEGIYTQGIYGFINMLNKIESDYSPEYMAVAWDRKAPTFRHEEYDGYKAGRKAMPPELAMEMPLMKDILNAMKIKNLEIDGFEADDIIGTVARVAEEEGLEPLIITGDKDALQLATDVTKVLITRKGITDFDLYDREKMIERYSLTPEQFIDLKGLMGDSSDNLPGIPGVGEKTGIKLLEQFGSVANLLANTDQIANAKLRAKVEENAQLAAMSRRLAEINRFVPIEFTIDEMEAEEPDYKTLVDIYVKLEFNSFLKKLHIGDIAAADSQTDTEEDKIEYVRKTGSVADVDNFSDGADVTIKVFSDGNHVSMPIVTGAALLCGEQYLYVSFDDEEQVRAFTALMNEKEFSICGHGLIRDCYSLMRYGLTDFSTAFDTEIAQYVLDSNKSDYSLKTLALEKLHIEIKSEKEFGEETGQMDLLGNNEQKYSDYGFDWCVAANRVRKMQKKEIEDGELEKVCYNVEFPLIEVLASMECDGFSVNKDTLESLGVVLKEEISKTEQSIYEMSGTEFNINSTQQLGEVLFEKMGLPSGKKTKRGYSTSAEVLEKLKDKSPIIELILSYRTLSKLNSTYVEGLKPLISQDGKIRAHFQQTVAATGRISCTEPNLQNIPVRYPLGRQLRKAFVADEGCTLVGADYSQIELRILAHMSGDENLIASFERGDDIHRATAARVFELDYDKVTPLDRSRAKAVNFGVIYGMSGFGLAEELHISRKQAESYIAEYFEKHQAVKTFMDGQVAGCKANGYTRTILGRKRYINEINSSNYMVRQLGERLAMNSPIQGSAADVIKIAMIRVYHELKEKNYKSRLVLQIHDELIILTSRDEIDAVSELLVRNMEEAMDLSVKLECDLNTADSWYDLK